ncbi:unnamed protein product [Nezara viridula]|uniref:Gustatory receptor n=1 Tax=Nezara viridula TaxID=85310 RepID=A0A9P0MP77_NEZVI|nr:unnamed protein product [Nezara viridula]
MKPIFILMRLIGRFPYSFTKTGIAPFSLISWPFLYSIVFHLIFVLLTAWSNKKIIIDKIYPSESYDETLFWSLLLLYAFQNFTGPITFWWDAPRTVRYFQKWKDFEDIWRCGTIYSVKRLRYIKVFTILLTPITIIIVIYEALILPQISVLIFVPYVPILIAAVLMLEHWWVSLHDLTMYSEKLLTSIFKAKNRRDMGYRRRMWLKISELVTEIGNATGASGLSYSSTYFVGFILSIYAILINIARPSSSNVSIWGLVFPAAYSAISYYLAADAAYRATERIGPAFTKKLLQIDLSFLQQSCLNEIDLLVNSLSAKAPVIEYLGFMKVTRSTFVHFVSSTLTYLVVLVQLKTNPKELGIDPILENDNSTSYENLTS